ncbi:MAG: hypothetical protein IT458_06000 [Planctomycetes bacterium]|nr:hypothetical protein [Planctomycetota bacterium]
MALARRAHWVWVDRDHTPALPRRFSVSAYPSLLFLGTEGENIHRFAGFLNTTSFLAPFREGFERYDRYRAGAAYDAPPPWPEAPVAGRTTRVLQVPGADALRGIAWHRGELLLASLGELIALDGTGREVRRVPLPDRPNALASDGERLYGLHYGWTAGRPIYELDPATGAAVRQIVTRANADKQAFSATGLACHGGRLHVLTVSGAIHVVDPASGVVERTVTTRLRYVSALAFDGRSYVVGGRDSLNRVDPGTGEVVGCVPLLAPVRGMTFHAGALHLFEQVQMGFDRNHRPKRIAPDSTRIHVVEWQP